MVMTTWPPDFSFSRAISAAGTTTGSKITRTITSSARRSIACSSRASSRRSQTIRTTSTGSRPKSETGFIFNVHVVETNPENKKQPGRVYVDPMGEKLAGGLIKAPKISYGKVNQLYG